jgi:hypothetical protein
LKNLYGEQLVPLPISATPFLDIEHVIPAVAYVGDGNHLKILITLPIHMKIEIFLASKSGPFKGTAYTNHSHPRFTVLYSFVLSDLFLCRLISHHTSYLGPKGPDKAYCVPAFINFNLRVSIIALQTALGD